VVGPLADAPANQEVQARRRGQLDAAGQALATRAYICLHAPSLTVGQSSVPPASWNCAGVTGLLMALPSARYPSSSLCPGSPSRHIS
jgi:hypothetical protein